MYMYLFKSFSLQCFFQTLSTHIYTLSFFATENDELHVSLWDSS